MQMDLEDILASTFGRILRQGFLFGSAVWVGCMVGALALVIGACGSSSHGALEWLSKLWLSPLLLLSIWLLPNLAVLLGGLAHFIISESAGFTAWGVLVALESFFVVAAWASSLQGAGPIAIAWISWLILLGMLETGVWLIRNMLSNHWARQLAVLRMENAHRRAEREVAERPGTSHDGEESNF